MNDPGTGLGKDVMPDMGRRAFIVLLGRTEGASPMLSPNAIGSSLQLRSCCAPTR